MAWVAPNQNGPGVLPILGDIDFDAVVTPFGSIGLDSLPDILELVHEYQKVLDQELSGKLSAEEMENIRAQMEEVTREIEAEVRDLDHQFQDHGHFRRAPSDERIEEMEAHLLQKQMELKEKMSALQGKEQEEVRRQLEQASEQMALARKQLRGNAGQRNVAIARALRDEQRRQREVSSHIQREQVRAQREIQREQREMLGQARREYERALRHKEREDRSAVARTEIIEHLLADGLIQDREDRIKLDYQNNQLKINGKKITGDQKAGYIDLLRRHYRLKDSDKLRIEFSPNRSSVSHESE